MSKYLNSEGLDTLWGIIKSTFAASISIDDRTISLKNKSGNTLGSTITIPSTATSLATAGTIQIDLASTSSVTYTSGGNITPGVKNALKVANGGTGKSSLDSGKALIGNGTNAVTLRNIYTRTESGNLEWTSGTSEYLLTKGAIAYWNGAYGTTGKSNITTLGTITTGVWNGTAIDVAYGGTGIASNPSMLVNLASTTADTVFETSPRPGVTGTLGIGNGGTGQTTAKDASNVFINALDTETTALQDGDYFIAQTAGGGTTTTTYKRKALSTLATYVENKISDSYLPLSGGTMTGNISWASSSALSRNSSPLYLLSIDAFNSGGATHYSNMSDVATALKDYVVATTNAVIDIPSGSDLDTYTTTGIFRAKTTAIASRITNTPIAKAFTMLVMPTTANGCIQFVSEFTTTEHNFWQRSMYNDSWGGWKQYMPYAITCPYESRLTNINLANDVHGVGSMFHFIAAGTTTTGRPYADANIVQMNWDTSSGYNSQIAVHNAGKFLGFRGQNSGTWNGWNYASTINYAECTDASDVETKSITLSGNVSGITGTEITVKFVNGNTNTKLKLTVNLSPSGTLGTGKAVYYRGTFVDQTYIKPNDIVRMVYDGTRWNIVGSINSVTSYGNHIRYYIHGTNGSDTNDGLTENTPFATFEKFFEVTANAGYTDCRCIVLKGGTYYLHKQALNNVTLHIKVNTGVTDAVILQGDYGVSEDWIMYNAHVKLTGTANAPIVYQPYSTNGIYFENSAVTLDYVKFSCRMQGFGCYIKADHIGADRLHFSGCTGYLADVTITNKSHAQHGIVLDRGCNMRISGTFTIGALTDGVASSDANKDKNYFFNIQDSDIVLQSSYSTTLYDFDNNSTIDITTDSNRTAYSYAYGMRLSNAEITGTRIRLASYVSRGVNKTMLADEESDINVTWGGKKTGGESDGRAGFTSLYGYETATFTTPASDVSATSIKTWIIAKSTIDAAVQSAHPNVGTSSYPYDVVAVVPISTSDNKIVFKDTEYIPTSDATNPGAIRVIVRNVTSTAIPAPSSTNPGATATVNVIYTMKPFSVTYKS